MAHTGRIAQLVEQRTENPCVEGSNPPPTTMNLKASTLGGFFHVLWDFQVKKGKPPEGSRQPAMVGGISSMAGFCAYSKAESIFESALKLALKG